MRSTSPVPANAPLSAHRAAPEVATAPQLALCLWDQATLSSAEPVVTAATGGLDVLVGTHLPAVLSMVSAARLKLVIVEADLVQPGALEALVSVCPEAQILLVTELVEDRLLELAGRIPQILGFVASTAGRIRTWELGYLVRRILTPEREIPRGNELLTWGASTHLFRPRTARQHELVPLAIDLATHWYGATEEEAVLAGEAAQLMLEHLVVDPGLESPPDDLIPTIRMTVDASYLAVDLLDPFGKVTRPQMMRALSRGRGDLRPGEDPVERALAELYRTATLLRIDSAPGQMLFSWTLDRFAFSRRSSARSVYLVETR